jgi:predicted dehydrogenase
MSTADKLRVVQVGCGPRGRAHLAAMQACGAVDLVAICDRHAEKVDAAGDAFGIARRYGDLAAMIAAEGPDLVDIVTAPSIRVGIVEEALAAGAPAILIEKPIALTPPDAQRLAALGEERLIAVNTQYPWMPHWQRFWDLLQAQELGPLRTLRVGTRANILEQGVHVVDLALRAAALGGWPAPEWVLAACDGVESMGTTPIPADTCATIGLGEGRLHLNSGPSAPAVPDETVYWYHMQVEIVGDRGRLWVSLNQGWQLWREGAVARGETAWPKNDGEAQAALYVALRDTLLGPGGQWRQFPTRIGVAAQTAALLFACMQSAAEQRRIALGAPTT